MMPLAFCKFANAIYEVECRAEVLELEVLAQVVLVNDLPTGELAKHFADFVALHRRHTAPAWNTLSRS
jgi:hypothetical protein